MSIAITVKPIKIIRKIHHTAYYNQFSSSGLISGERNAKHGMQTYSHIKYLINIVYFLQFLKSSCLRGTYLFLVSLFLHQLTETRGRINFCLSTCMGAFSVVNFSSFCILRIIYVIIHSKYFPNSDWLKTHA